MRHLTKLTAAVVLATASLTANAWWGMPGHAFDDNFFGDGDFSFSVSMSGRGSGWNRYADYYGPYGYAPYGAYVPVALTAEQQKALQSQQKAWLDAHNQAVQQAVEAERQFMDQLAKHPKAFSESANDPFLANLDRGFGQLDQLDPFAKDPMALTFENDPSAPPLPAHIKERMEKAQAQAKAQREKALKEFSARREEVKKQIEARRKSLLEKVKHVGPVEAPVPQDI
ncbi:putative Transcriptional regulator [Gammaproteobacteria bacterium]